MRETVPILSERTDRRSFERGVVSAVGRVDVLLWRRLLLRLWVKPVQTNVESFTNGVVQAPFPVLIL